jgi:hypothetical protein
VVLRTVQRGANSLIGIDIALIARMLESTGQLALTVEFVHLQFSHAGAVWLPTALQNAKLPIGRSTVHTVRLGLEKRSPRDERILAGT